MKFLNLIVENFGAIKSANIRLDNQGLVLIQGENKDDSSAMSNGAGKSTVPDALCWALYGVTARGDSGDKVINRTAKSDCRVTVHITDGDFSWSISRYRKHSVGKNRVTVEQVNVATGAINDLTQGTDKATQDVIDKILGCTVEVFMASIYAGQEAMPNLPGMTDKQLKELIEQSAGIDRLQRAYEQARIEQQQAVVSHNEVFSKLEAAIERHRQNQARLREYKEAESKYEDEAAGKIAGLILAKKELFLEEEGVESVIKSFDPKLDSMYQAAIDALSSVSDEQKKLAVYSDLLRNRERDLAKVEATLDAAISSAKKKRSEYENIEEVMGKPCAACGKPHTPEEREELLKHIGEQLKVQVEAVRSIKIDVEAAKVARDDMQKAIDDFRASMKDTSALTEEIAKYQSELERRASSEKALAHIRSKIEMIDKQIESIKEAANPYTKLVASQRSEIVSSEAEVAECEKVLKIAESDLELAKMAVEVFGPAGVRAHILDTVTPFLNAKTAEYLNALSDGNLTAIWTTLGKTAKGEVREKFNIEVSSTTAGEGFGSLSGGEKRKVRLACAMALQDLVASRATKPIDLFIGDEIDHALDPAGLERLMGVLEQKAKERGTVLVISHGDLTDWIRQVMVVTKKGGYSTVSGALVI